MIQCDTVADSAMRPFPIALALVAVIPLLVVACASEQPAAFIPEGVSPPIPMVASAEMHSMVADAIGAPPPSAGGDAPLPDDPVEAGKIVVARNACGSCHSIDGSALVGPSWKGLFGRVSTMTSGATVTADEGYIAESIRTPQAKIVLGFDNSMSNFGFLSDTEVEALVAYIKTLE